MELLITSTNLSSLMVIYLLTTNTLREVQLQFYKMTLICINSEKRKRKLYLGGFPYYYDKEVDTTVVVL